MTGPNKHVVLQPRDYRLLSLLSQLRLVDREMTKIIAGFGSTTRVNKRLLELTRAGLLHRFFVGTFRTGLKAVYTLSPSGAAAAQVSYSRIKRKSGEAAAADLFVAHQLLVNAVIVLVHFQPIPLAGIRCLTWRTFSDPPASAIALIPDAYFELETPAGIRSVFLEVDRGTEPLSVWQKKVTDYLRLATSGEFGRFFRQSQFRVLVVAPSERRVRNIANVIAKCTDRIFFLTTLDAITPDKFWSPVWLRPTGDLRSPPL